ncbi:MAG: hypothetical protein H6752_03150 [Candidatus Omnitrophica bacterium]|nr:hypothetical protein [Candidatus Omnitrophota bacterium]
MSDHNLHTMRELQPKECPTKDRERSSHRVAVFLMILIGLLAFSAYAPLSSLSTLRLSQALDPTRSTSTLEVLWALLAWIPQQILGWLHPPPFLEASLFPCVGTAFIVALGPRGWLQPVAFLFWAILLGTASNGFLQITGPDTLALVLFTAMGMCLTGRGRGLRRAGWGLAGLLSASGWVFAIPIAFFLGLFHLRKLREGWAFLAVGVVCNLTIHLILQIRYPNPDRISFDPPFLDFVQSWVGLDPPIPWFQVKGWPGYFAIFPGSLGLVAGILAFPASMGLRKVWDYSAGRTVPFQTLIYLALLGVVIAVVGLARPGDTKQQLSIEEANRNLRTLRLKAVNPTVFEIPSDLLGPAHLMSEREAFDYQSHILPLPPGAFEREAMESPPSELPLATDWVGIEYNGENFLRVFDEPLDFHPHYLLDASTEVWAATPQFFVANDPNPGKEHPTLSWNREPLKKISEGGRLFQDWNWDGGHFFLYKVRQGKEWEPLDGKWTVDYSGYLLESDFKKYGDRVRPRIATPLKDFY